MEGLDPALSSARPPRAATAAPRTRRTRRLDGARLVRWGLKPAIWIACLVPLGLLVHDFFTGGLGANPIEKVTLTTGKTALILLMVALSVTPLRRLTGWNQLAKVRRLLGLFAFFYVALHFAIYIGLDQFFAFGDIAEDILERPYITVGFAAFMLLLPLAITSTTGWIRRLGRRWRQLHRLVYVAAGLGVLHYFWKVKADTREPLLFAGILAVLLLLRLPLFRKRTARG